MMQRNKSLRKTGIQELNNFTKPFKVNICSWVRVRTMGEPIYITHSSHPDPTDALQALSQEPGVRIPLKVKHT